MSPTMEEKLAEWRARRKHLNAGSINNEKMKRPQSSHGTTTRRFGTASSKNGARVKPRTQVKKNPLQVSKALTSLLPAGTDLVVASRSRPKSAGPVRPWKALVERDKENVSCDPNVIKKKVESEFEKAKAEAMASFALRREQFKRSVVLASVPEAPVLEEKDSHVSTQTESFGVASSSSQTEALVTVNTHSQTTVSFTPPQQEQIDTLRCANEILRTQLEVARRKIMAYERELEFCSTKQAQMQTAMMKGLEDSVARIQLLESELRDARKQVSA